MEEINKLINQQKGAKKKRQNRFCSITVAILNGVLISHINISTALVKAMYCTPTFFLILKFLGPNSGMWFFPEIQRRPLNTIFII